MIFEQVLCYNDYEYPDIENECNSSYHNLQEIDKAYLNREESL